MAIIKTVDELIFEINKSLLRESLNPVNTLQGRKLKQARIGAFEEALHLVRSYKESREDGGNRQ